MQRYAEGKSREQIQILSYEEMISEDNPVRVIDAFVNSLDMIKLGFKYAETKETGRKPINPAEMCKLYTYSYFNGIRSSRKIEKECNRNIEVMWLINNQTPHNRTISEFRKNNKKAIENMFKEFSILCDMMGLIGKEIVAIDGSKFRASNSRRNNFTKNKVKKMLEHYEDTARKYTELLEKSDNEEDRDTSNLKCTKEEIQERVKAAQNRIEELKLMSEEIEKNGEISIIDKDAKHMSVSNNGTDVSHNVQIAVDSKSHLVVAVDVTSSPADQGQLYTVAKEAAKELRIGLNEIKEESEESRDEEISDIEFKFTVLADKGYYVCEDLRDCLKSGIKPIVSKPKSRNMTGNEKYVIDNFVYDKQSDTYTCPEGQILLNCSNKSSKNHIYKNKSACMNCKFKNQCIANDDYRKIKRNKNHAIYDMISNIMAENKDMYKQRQIIVEHVFGTVKRALGYTYFLTRGNESVRAESFMHFFTYNLKRVINKIGVRPLIETLKSYYLCCFFEFTKTIYQISLIS
jgi:transposase